MVHHGALCPVTDRCRFASNVMCSPLKSIELMPSFKRFSCVPGSYPAMSAFQSFGCGGPLRRSHQISGQLYHSPSSKGEGNPPFRPTEIMQTSSNEWHRCLDRCTWVKNRALQNRERQGALPSLFPTEEWTRSPMRGSLHTLA